jgi:hypothetical protein
MHVGRRDRGGIVFQVLLDHVVSSVQTGRGDDGRSSTGAGNTYRLATDPEDANLPPVPPVTALLKAKQLESTPGG